MKSRYEILGTTLKAKSDAEAIFEANKFIVDCGWVNGKYGLYHINDEGFQTRIAVIERHERHSLVKIEDDITKGLV